MPYSSNHNDLKTWLYFPLRDPHPVEKLAVGGLISLANLVIPGLGTTFMYGYAWQMLRGGREPFLPEWRDWEEIFIEGMKLFTIRLTYILPLILISMPLTLALFIPLYWSGPNGRGLPVETVLLIFGIWLALLALIGTALGMLLNLLSLPAVCCWVATGSFRQAFRVRAWWPIFRANVRGFVNAYLIGLGMQAVVALASLLLSFTLVLIPVVPFLSGAAATYVTLVTLGLAARAYREGASRLSPG